MQLSLNSTRRVPKNRVRNTGRVILTALGSSSYFALPVARVARNDKLEGTCDWSFGCLSRAAHFTYPTHSLVSLVAVLLARSQYSEGPATGHLDTGFSWFPCVYKRMLRWFPTFQVATTCFSCSPPDLNFLDPFHIYVIFISYLCTCIITTATGWQPICSHIILYFILYYIIYIIYCYIILYYIIFPHINSSFNIR